MPTNGKRRSLHKKRLKPPIKNALHSAEVTSALRDPPKKLATRSASAKRIFASNAHDVTSPRPRKRGTICPHVCQALLDRGEETYREVLQQFVIPSSKCLIPWDTAKSRRLHKCVDRTCSAPFQFVCCHCKEKGCRAHAKDHAVASSHGCAIGVDLGYVACFFCGDSLVQMEKYAKIWREHRLASTYENALRHGWIPDLIELQDVIPQQLRDACEKRHALVGVHGIVNLSNTCCLNVILQAFCHTPLFRDFCLARLHRCKPNSLRFDHSCVMCAFTSMIFDLYILPPGQCYAPQIIFQAVQSSLLDHGSELGEQEDPAEIINLLLNDMHLHSERDGRKISVALSDKLHLSGRENASLCVAHGIYCSCIVCDLFSGVEEYTTTCLKCKQDRVQGNSFKLLMLPIRDDKPTEAGKPSDLLLEDCLKMYTDNQFTSEVKNECCVDVKGAYRTHKFQHLPVVLIIQLKRAVTKAVRARTGDGDLKKNKEHIQFPLVLDMAPYMADSYAAPTRYVLYGVIVHKGVKLSSGHYVCYIKHMSGRWFCMDDRGVFCFTESHVLSLQAYMLFYILETVEFTVASPDISSADIPPAIPAVGPYFPSPDTWVEDDLEMPPPLKVDDTYSLITLKARSPLYEVDISRFSFDHTYSKMSRKPKAISPDSDREVYPDEDKSGDLETVDLESAELLDLLYTL